MKTVNTINFGIQRKIVANMTTESWETIPHVTYNYEPDVTDFMKEYKKLNFDRKGAGLFRWTATENLYCSCASCQT